MIQHYVIKFVGDLRQVNGFLPVLQFSSTKKTDCHNMTEILLKAVLNTINQTIYWNLDLPMNLVPMWRLSMKCFPQELQFSQCLKVAVKIPRIPMNLQKTWSYVNDPNLYCYNFQGICPIFAKLKISTAFTLKTFIILHITFLHICFICAHC